MDSTSLHTSYFFMMEFCVFAFLISNLESDETSYKSCLVKTTEAANTASTQMNQHLNHM